MAINEKRSYTEVDVTQPTSDFDIGFKFYEERDGINSTVDGVPASAAGYTTQLVNGNTLRFTPTVLAGAVVRIMRETNIDKNVYTFSSGALWTAEQMDENFEQLRHSQQESRDTAAETRRQFDRLDTQVQTVVGGLDAALEVAENAAEAAQSAADSATQAVETVNDFVAGGIAADKVLDASGKNQQEINDNQGVKNSLSVDILDYIPKSQWNAIFNRTSAYDCSGALEQAINSGLEVKVSKSGLYLFKTAKEYVTDIKVTAEAPDVWFDFSQVPATQVGLKNSGSATLLVSAFASTITEGDRSITLPDVSALKAGDTLCFYNPSDFSFSGYRSYYRDGEFLKVQQIIGNVVYFTNPVKSSYAVSSIDIYKLNLKNVVLRDIKVRYYTTFTNGVGGLGAMRFDFCDFKSYNFYAEAQSSQVLALSRCPNPKLYNTSGFNLGSPTFGSGGLEYFVLFGNCQDWRMYGGDIYSQRHAVAQGGGADICSIPVSGKAYDLTTRNYFSTSVGSFDAHGNVRECKLVNCTIYNSAKFAGSGVIYENCKIYGSQTGVIVLTTEFKGGRHGLINCELISYASPRAASRSFVDFGSNTEVITDKTVLDSEIFILNTKVKLRNADALDQFCRIVNRGGAKKVNINIDNLTFDTDVKISSVVRISSIVSSPTAVADSDYIIIDNIVGKNAPIPIVHENDAYKQFPHRLPVIRGVKRATTTASATVPVTGVPYGYTLPKRPFLDLSIAGADGAALSTLGGQSLFMPVPSATGFTTFNASINAAAAFTAGAEFDLQYTASIREC